VNSAVSEVREVPGLIIEHGTREWCLLPYPDHPKGCPNFGKSKVCPPFAPHVESFVDLALPLWFVIEEFDLKSHVARMISKHAGWSDRQARCVLYWQGSVKSRLQASADRFCLEHPGTHHTLCPEAMGVNVIATGRSVGLPIQSSPLDTIFKIALVGYIKE